MNEGENHYLSLEQIIGGFNAPISEQHAWAVIYESLRTLDALLKDFSTVLRCDEDVSCYLRQVSKCGDIFVEQSGKISDETFIGQEHKGESFSSK